MPMVLFIGAGNPNFLFTMILLPVHFVHANMVLLGWYLMTAATKVGPLPVLAWFKLTSCCALALIL